jgi:hypothetical protein
MRSDKGPWKDPEILKVGGYIFQQMEFILDGVRNVVYLANTDLPLKEVALQLNS